jgi:hypothetical protein
MAGQLYFFKERQKLAFVSGLKNKAGIPAHAPECSLFFSVTSPGNAIRVKREWQSHLPPKQKSPFSESLRA